MPWRMPHTAHVSDGLFPWGGTPVFPINWKLGKKFGGYFFYLFWGVGWKSLRKSESSLLGTTFLKT